MSLNLSSLPIKNLPKALPIRKLIGPSFIILGVGLGSGELILWPYLSSNFGLGIIWAAVLGITFQFFINMEIERYTLATGESIFVGLTRRFGKFAPYWFIATTLVPWLWPGIAASSATVLASGLGITYSKYLGIGILLFIGILYSLGQVIYKTQEKVQKAIILTGVPFIFLLTVIFTKEGSIASLLSGLIGKGEGYWFFPEALPISIFLSALAYAGAGGNLNLAQSLYVKEKGYGMAFYSNKLINVMSKKDEKAEILGADFEKTKENIDTFNLWWKRINIEHAIVFWITGAFTMIMLALLAFNTVYGDPKVVTSINFVLREAEVISSSVTPTLSTFFLIMAGIMLLGTQFSVYGSNSRIATENVSILKGGQTTSKTLSKYFYGFLWAQILAGVLIFSLGFTEPLTLVVTGAIMNAFSMFIYTGMVLYTNSTLLHKSLRPNMFRFLTVGTAFLFYGGFSIYTIILNLQKLF